MGRFLDFLVRYHAFFLFVGIEVLCFALYFQNVEYANGEVYYSANAVVGSVHKKYSNVQNYFELKNRNDSLATENARLMAQLENAYSWDTISNRCIEDSLYNQLYEYYAVRVVNNQIHGRNNFITIDRGTNHGVKKDMGVINGDGIVGKVVQADKDFSVVMSVLHSKFWVSAALEKSDIIGRLSWNGKNPDLVQLSDIASHVELKKGDRVVTTGFSSVFPEGIPIGEIDQIRAAKGSYFYEVDVRLSTKMSSLRHVYVVNYLQHNARADAENGARGL